MKQGRASSSGMGSTKPATVTHNVNVSAVANMGNMRGNHVMEEGTIHVKSEPLYKGRGIEAPKKTNTVHPKGSQGGY